MRGIQHLGAVKGLWGSAVASWKTEENPGAILAFVLGTEDLLEVGAGPEGSHPQKSTELSIFIAASSCLGGAFSRAFPMLFQAKSQNP